MIHQPTLVRDRLVRLVSDMLFAFRTHVTMMPQLEPEILNALEPIGRQAITIVVVNTVLVAVGGERSEAKEPRFDKTRRALAKKTRKGPRGVPKKRVGGSVQAPIGGDQEGAATTLGGSP